MERGEDARCPGRAVLEHAVVLRQSEVATEEDLSRGRPEANDDFGPHDRDLGLEPAAACMDLECVWLRVKAAFAAWLPLEVLHRVREVDLLARDLCLVERLVEEHARWADERTADEILAIPGLLADEHHRSRGRAFAEDDLCGALVQVTCLTPLGSLRELVEVVGSGGDVREGR